MKEVKELLNYEADQMHHNASLLGTLSSMDSYGESIDGMFDECLSSYLEQILLPDLSARIEGKFQIDLTFRQYGRGGATIGPEEWVIEGHGIMSEYSGIDGDLAIEAIESQMTDYWDEDKWTNVSAYNALRRLLSILEYINDYWTKQVANCPRWWRETAESFLETA